MRQWIFVGHDDDVAAIRRMAELATPMAIRVAVTLGLPDRLLDTPATAGDLAAELAVSPGALDLLLAHLTTVGIVDRTSAGYRTTGFGAHLGARSGDGFTNLLLDMRTAAGRAELAFVELAHSIATGEAAYARRYGQGFWADLAEQPRLRESFDRQMTLRFHDRVPRIVAGFDWSRFATVVDVGGGQGTLLAAILAAHRGIRGHLVDLEATAADARRTFTAHGLTDRTEVTGGGFFDPLPAGADAYVLFDILHDWDDEHAHRILAGCAEAAGPTGRILVVEAVGGLRADSRSDLTVLVLYGGHERRLDEFRELGSAHGLVVDSVTTLTDERCLVEFRPTG